ncbi:MAG: DMT family transporter [Patescibacteria group bacterium]
MIIIGIPQIIIGAISVEAIIGNILIILASISFVIGAVISKKILTKYSTLVVTAVAFMVGTVTMFIPATLEYIRNPDWISEVTILGFLGLIYMTLLSSISAYFLFEWGLSKTSVIVSNLFQYIEPFIATLLAVAILSEKVSVSFFTGAFLIAAGVYLGTLAKEAHHRQHKAHRV